MKDKSLAMCTESQNDIPKILVKNSSLLHAYAMEVDLGSMLKWQYLSLNWKTVKVYFSSPDKYGTDCSLLHTTELVQDPD